MAFGGLLREPVHDIINTARQAIKTDRPNCQKNRGRLRQEIGQLAYLLPLAKPYARLGIAGAIMIAIATVLGAFQPMILKFILDDVVKEGNYRSLTVISMIFVGVVVSSNLLSLVAGRTLYRFQQGVISRLHAALFLHVLRLPLLYFSSMKTGHLVSRFDRDVWYLESIFSVRSITVVTSFLRLVFGLSMLFWLDGYLGGVACLVLPIYALLAARFRLVARSLSEPAAEAAGELSQRIFQALLAIKVVKVFNQESAEANRVRETLNQAGTRRKDEECAYAVSESATALLGEISCVLILAFGACKVMGSEMSIGTLVGGFAYLGYLFHPAATLFSYRMFLQPSLAALGRLILLLRETPETGAKRTCSNTPRNLTGKITFRNVCFRFPENDQYVLRNLSFSVLPGEKVAIVGSSGAGKTTILNLILGLYKPESGSILYDGIDVSHLPLDYLRDHIGLVSQDLHLFMCSVADNIRYGHPEADDEGVRRAAEIANAHSFVGRLPAGYETQLGERGATLSEGQRQRICVARTLVRPFDILVLDEISSSLDPSTELEMMTRLNACLQNKTAILVTHRLSTLTLVDRVMLLEDGRIVEQGNHSHLACSDGAYSRLFGLHSGGAAFSPGMGRESNTSPMGGD